MTEPHEHARFWAIRVKNSKGGVKWLYAAIIGRFYAPVYQHHEFYHCDKELGERPEWLLTGGPGRQHEGPTWFKSLTAAKRRLRTTVLKNALKSGHEIEIVRTRLIAHEAVAYTSAKDAVSKLGAVAGKSL